MERARPATAPFVLSVRVSTQGRTPNRSIRQEGTRSRSLVLCSLVDEIGVGRCEIGFVEGVAHAWSGLGA